MWFIDGAAIRRWTLKLLLVCSTVLAGMSWTILLIETIMHHQSELGRFIWTGLWMFLSTFLFKELRDSKDEESKL